MVRIGAAGASLAVAVALAAVTTPGVARAQQEQQAIVDRATLTAQEMLNDRDGTEAQYLLRRSRAALICPRVFRAGFVFGGEGGDCVLVARDGAGSWSSPAFYGMGAGSVGFQIGIQDAEVMLMILTERGLSSIMDSQFKLGADAKATFIAYGGGVEGATTAALRADIVGFTRARGLYAGVSISGSLLNSRTEWNQAYYGRPLAARQIVVGMEASNPGADPLRQVLMRFGFESAAADQPAAPGLPPPVPAGPSGYAGGGYTPPPLTNPQPYTGQTYAPSSGRAPIQQQPLPLPPSPPRR